MVVGHSWQRLRRFVRHPLLHAETPAVHGSIHAPLSKALSAMSQAVMESFRNKTVSPIVSEAWLFSGRASSY